MQALEEERERAAFDYATGRDAQRREREGAVRVARHDSVLASEGVTGTKRARSYESEDEQRKRTRGESGETREVGRLTPVSGHAPGPGW